MNSLKAKPSSIFGSQHQDLKVLDQALAQLTQVGDKDNVLFEHSDEGSVHGPEEQCSDTESD